MSKKKYLDNTGLSQVVTLIQEDTDNRIGVALENVVYAGSDDSEETDELLPVDSDTLEGHRADYFATAQSVTDIVDGTTPVGNSNKLGGNLPSAFARTDGSLAQSAVGKDGYIAYPDGGFYRGLYNLETGRIRITLPKIINNIMINFEIAIRSHEDNDVALFRIAGFISGASQNWSVESTAYSIGRQDSALATRSVIFNTTVENAVITIGDDTDIWSYPVVTVQNISFNGSTSLGAGYDTVGTGWSVSITSDNSDLIVSAMVDNPYINYGIIAGNHFRSVIRCNTQNAWYRLGTLTTGEPGIPCIAELTIAKHWNSKGSGITRLEVKYINYLAGECLLLENQGTQPFSKYRLVYDKTDHMCYIDGYYYYDTYENVSLSLVGKTRYGSYSVSTTPTIVDEELSDTQTLFHELVISSTMALPATTADLANYLSLTGGKITSADNIPLILSHTATDSTACWQEFENVSGVVGFLGFANKDVPSYVKADGTVIYNLLHTGNKPSGTYTGTGVARTINTGGIGRAVLVAGASRAAIVCTGGAFGHHAGTFKSATNMYHEVNTDSFNLSSDTWLNESGIVYTYWVL